jgi:hypothetical protein
MTKRGLVDEETLLDTAAKCAEIINTARLFVKGSSKSFVPERKADVQRWNALCAVLGESSLIVPYSGDN